MYVIQNNTKHQDLSNTKNTLFITAPIYYINGNPHLGHAYTSIAVDTITRFYKIFIGPASVSFGTDEHGLKVESASVKSGYNDPQTYSDIMTEKFKQLIISLDCQIDQWIRTTDLIHKETALWLWKKIYKNGFIYEGSYKGWYSVSDEAYYKESEVENGICIETGSSVEWHEERCYFFKLRNIKEYLIEFYSANPESIQPKSKLSEVMGLLKSDLPDIPISRSKFKWGINIPNDESQIMYVWIDALSSYITSIKKYCIQNNTEFNESMIGSLCHIVGKDILKFHAVYWPALLKAANIPLPKIIFAHGWITIRGEKMSKSKNNMIEPSSIVEEYGIDETRYALMKLVNFGHDSAFDPSDIERIINTELSNEIGNLVHRVLSFCIKRFKSTLKCTDKNSDILTKWDSARENAVMAMRYLNISGYLSELRNAVMLTNKWIEEQKPWKNPNQSKCMGILCMCLQRMCIMIYPIMPRKAFYLADLLGMQGVDIRFWDESIFAELNEISPMFKKYEQVP